MSIALGALAANCAWTHLVYAGCTNSSGNVVCSGTTSGSYTASGNILNADISGVWTASGSSTGIFYSKENANRFVTVNHRGELVWNDARYGGSGTGTRSAFNLNFTYGSVAQEITYISTEDSKVTVNVNPGLTNNRSLNAVSAYTPAGVGRIDVQNAGQISVTSNITNSTGGTIGIALLGRDNSVINSGTIDMLSQGSGNAAGIYLTYTTAGGAGPSRLYVSNSGTSHVNAAIREAATWTSALSLEAIDVTVETIEAHNSGLLKLEGGLGSAGRATVRLAGGTRENTFSLFNLATGEILSEDENPIAIHTIGQSHLRLENEGRIVGAINGGALSDLVTFGATSETVGAIDLSTGNDDLTSAGRVVGDLILGGGSDRMQLAGGEFVGVIYGDNVAAAADDGNDAFVWSGGVLSGAVHLGDGSDTATISAAGYDGTQLLDGGDDVSAADGWIDSLTFSGVSATVAGANLTNWEKISLDNTSIVISDGALTTGSEEGTGLFVGSGSVLDAGGSLALTGNLHLASGATFKAAGGLSTISGTLANDGLITVRNGTAGDVIRVGGLYSSASGAIELDTVLGDDASATDVLYLDGGSAGATQVRINNVGGAGAATVEGIKVIDVTGASNGAFTLVGDYVHENEQAIVAGAYAYKLKKGGASSPSDGDWYLRSNMIASDAEPAEEPAPIPDPGQNPGQNPGQTPGPTPEPSPTPEPAPAPAPTPAPESARPPAPQPLYQPGAPVYETYPQLLSGLAQMTTLQQRVGNRYWTGNGAARGANAQTDSSPSLIERDGVWGRIEGTHGHLDPRRSTASVRYEYDRFRMQIGVDGALLEDDDKTIVGGLSAHYSHGSAHIRSPHDAVGGGGKISSDGYGIGAALTRYDASGYYVDTAMQVTWLEGDLWSDGGQRKLVSENDARVFAFSFESGRRHALDAKWSLTPQAQVSYNNVNFDSFTDPFGARVSLVDGDTLDGRAGVTLDYEHAWEGTREQINRAHFYGIANVYYAFLDRTLIDVSGTTFTSARDHWWGGLGLGGSLNFGERYSLYGEGLVTSSLHNFGDSYSFMGVLGFRISW